MDAPVVVSRGARHLVQTLRAAALYLFTGVRPSSAAATSARSSESDISQAESFSSVSAPEDGRTPLNTYAAL